MQQRGYSQPPGHFSGNTPPLGTPMGYPMPGPQQTAPQGPQAANVLGRYGGTNPVNAPMPRVGVPMNQQRYPMGMQQGVAGQPMAPQMRAQQPPQMQGGYNAPSEFVGMPMNPQLHPTQMQGNLMMMGGNEHAYPGGIPNASTPSPYDINQFPFLNATNRGAGR